MSEFEGYRHEIIEKHIPIKFEEKMNELEQDIGNIIWPYVMNTRQKENIAKAIVDSLMLDEHMIEICLGDRIWGLKLEDRYKIAKALSTFKGIIKVKENN
jgi:hypothetical protein